MSKRANSSPSRRGGQGGRRAGLGCSIALAIVLLVLLVGAGWATPRLLNLLNNPAAAAALTVSAGPSASQLDARRQEEQGLLESYGWVDKASNVARIPVARAIELLAAQGLPVGPDEASAATGDAGQNAPVDLANVSFDDVLPIFEQHCAECHGDDEPEEGLVLTSYKDVLAGSIYGSVVKPNDPEGSYLVELVSTGQMPKRGDDLSPAEIDTIVAWINAGLPEHATATAPTPDLANVSFASDVLPIFVDNCSECHGDDQPEEDLVLTSYKDVMLGSIYGAVVKPGDPDGSYLVELVASGQMPKRGDDLTPTQVETIVAWVKAGALDN